MEERERPMYVGRARGATRVPVSYERLEAAAREAMSPEGFAYAAGGAGREETMRANREAFQRWRLVSRMLRDVSRRDTSVALFDLTMSLAGCATVAEIGPDSVQPAS
jgi:lactate 2-monooxygenase